MVELEVEKPKEVEVTPEMIEAGSEVLKDFFYEAIFASSLPLLEICTELFRAMARFQITP